MLVMSSITVVNPAAMFCDAPGTPNNEMVTSDAPGMLSYSFANTARVSANSSPNGYLKINMYFEHTTDNE